MSFDLLVFDPAQAPRLRGAFLDWFRAGTLLAGHDYNSPGHLTPPLRQFYARLEPLFPPHSGFACAPPLSSADYCFAEGFIYLSFRHDAADPAYRTVLHLAHDTGVGFFNAASDWGEILHDRTQIAPYLTR